VIIIFVLLLVIRDNHDGAPARPALPSAPSHYSAAAARPAIAPPLQSSLMSLLYLVRRVFTFTPPGWSRAAAAWRWAPLVLWMLLIFVLSHQPKGAIPDAGEWDLLVKKGGHFFGYAVFWLLAWRAGFAPWAAFALAVAFGAGDELHQRLIPGRNGQLLDVFIDAAGALTALVLAARLRRRSRA
jgi:VanZ family protein